VIVNGTGSHRANTPDELRRTVGAEVYARHRVVNHDAHDPGTLVEAGTGIDGRPVLRNRDYVEADRRIVLGFLEPPHFMAGFSGGYKGIFPAVADIGAIMRYHDAATIGRERGSCRAALAPTGRRRGACGSCRAQESRRRSLTFYELPAEHCGICGPRTSSSPHSRPCDSANASPRARAQARKR
jgi:nickel-dependent lactate racemase